MEHPKREHDHVGFATLKEAPKPAALSPEARRELEHFRARHEAADEGFARLSSASRGSADTGCSIGLCSRSRPRSMPGARPGPANCVIGGMWSRAGFAPTLLMTWLAVLGGPDAAGGRRSRRGRTERCLSETFDPHLRPWFHGATRAFPLPDATASQRCTFRPGDWHRIGYDRGTNDAPRACARGALRFRDSTFGNPADGRRGRW